MYFVMYAVLTLNASLLLYAFIVVHSAMRIYDRLSLEIGSGRQRPSSNDELLSKPRMSPSFRRRASSLRDIHKLSLEDAAHDGNLEQEERLRAETLKLAQARRRRRRRATE